MIPRYSRPEMVAIWSPETKFRIWYEIEAHACDAQADLGVIPRENAEAVWKARDVEFDVARIDEIEAVIRVMKSGRVSGLTSEGEVHLRQRRLVQPAFHRERIHGYAESMIDSAARRSAEWQDGSEFDISDDMASLTFDIVGRTLFGADLRDDAAEVGAALDIVLGGLGQRLILGPSVLRIPSRKRSEALAASARLDAVVQRMIDDHRAHGGDSDMLGMLISSAEDGEHMTDQQVRDEAMTLILAGHETTAMALSWAWLLLAQHPHDREWLEEKLDAVLSDRDPRPEDYPDLPRTRAIIAETLRLYPPAWIMGRRLLTDVRLDDWLVPAGAITLASPWVTHRDHRWWSQARAFQPVRWLDADGHFDESAPGQPRGAWFPFGWGNRRCIGEAFAWMEAQKAEMGGGLANLFVAP